VEGRFIHFPDSTYSNEVMLSKIISNKLNVQVGDQVTVHFFQNPPRFRRLKVIGIYETNLSEYFDGKIIIGDIRLIARLNDWADSVAGGLEVFVNDVNRIDETGMAMSEKIDYDMNIQPVSNKYIQVFEWLHLLNRQVNILLIIILVVVCVNMISIILILVMERTQMIGMLKALGATDKLIRSIFVYNGVNLVVKGLLLGNAIGLGLCFIQDRFKFITLNPEDYYMSFVPISWHWEIIGLLNVLTFIVVTVVLLLPTAIIARISPIKAIRFD
jgi:lipoprotein-releasing system permease protein